MWLAQSVAVIVGTCVVLHLAVRVALWTLAWVRRCRTDGLELSLGLYLGDAVDGFASTPWAWTGGAPDISTHGNHTSYGDAGGNPGPCDGGGGGGMCGG